MPILNFDKEKYLEIMKTQGHSAALTQLQTDIAQWEVQAFEGPKGYQPQMWQEITAARDLAREIWDNELHSST